MRIHVLNGPNLNLLGEREPDIYGTLRLSDIETLLSEVAGGHELLFRQTQAEDELISWLHEAFVAKEPVIINPAAFTHYSYALRDAVAALTSSGVKVIEVHISNPHAREAFRHNSVISGVATGVIAGFGADSYLLALEQLTRD
jgi:3-dehydroquinate dehydratase-2